jgi:hypothetical protein
MRGHVLPEHGVVDVAAEVKGQVLLEFVDGSEVALLAGLGQLLQGGVGTLNVGVVVLVMVQFHDLARDVGLQCAVVVVEIGKGVNSHSSSCGTRYVTTSVMTWPLAEPLTWCNTEPVSMIPVFARFSRAVEELVLFGRSLWARGPRWVCSDVADWRRRRRFDATEARGACPVLPDFRAPPRMGCRV